MSRQVLCLGAGDYTLSNVFPLTGSKITIIGSGPATILKRITGVDGFVVSGDDVALKNLTFDGNGTAGAYAALVTGNRFRCQDVNFVGFGPNMGRGLVRVTKGAGDRWSNCGWQDSPAEHNLVFATDSGDITDFMVDKSHFSTTAGFNGVSIQGMPGGYAYSFHLNEITYTGSGRCLYMLLNTTKPRSGSVNQLNCELSGNSSTEMIGVWGCDSVQFSNIGGTDNNFGMSNQPFLAFHDANNCHATGYNAKLLNVGTQGFIALDSRYSSLDGFHIYGGGGNLNNTPGRGVVEVGMGAPGSSDSGFAIRNGTIEMPPGSTNMAIRAAEGLSAADTIDDLSVSGVTVKGTGAGTCVQFSTANGASFASPLLNDFHCSNMATGVNIGTGITGAMVGIGTWRNVTTPIVNNGTGTIVK